MLSLVDAAAATAVYINFNNDVFKMQRNGC
jgi:hypothetical protein